MNDNDHKTRWSDVATKDACERLDHQELLAWSASAIECINLGVQLMTLEQLSQWEGVRGVLESAPLAIHETTNEP